MAHRYFTASCAVSKNLHCLWLGLLLPISPGKNGKKMVKPGITRFYWIMAFGNYFFNPVINNLDCSQIVRCIHCFEWYNTLCSLNVIQHFRPGKRFKQQFSPLDHFHHTDPVNCINTRCPSWIMIEYTCRRHGSTNTQSFVHHTITGVTNDSFLPTPR